MSIREAVATFPFTRPRWRNPPPGPPYQQGVKQRNSTLFKSNRSYFCLLDDHLLPRLSHLLPLLMFRLYCLLYSRICSRRVALYRFSRAASCCLCR